MLADGQTYFHFQVFSGHVGTETEMHSARNSMLSQKDSQVTRGAGLDFNNGVVTCDDQNM